MKKIALFGLSAILLVSMAATKPKPKKTTKAAAKTTAKTATPAPVVTSDKAFDIKWDKTTHNFGEIAEGSEVKTTYVLTNMGKEPVIITTHNVECGCTTPEYSKEPIMPGKSANIVVGFNSNGKSGQQNKNVTLTFASGDKAVLNFTCFVGAKAKVDPMQNGSAVKLKSKN